MRYRCIGGRPVSAIGLGGMPMSLEGRPDERQSIATIHAALDAGVTLIDTADAYRTPVDEVGHNELLVAKALATYGTDASRVLVATKGGLLRRGDGWWTREESWRLDGSPRYLRAACQASLRRLGVAAIGLYQFHKPDPEVPYEESIGALRELLDEGLIEMAGISNASQDQIRIADRVLGGRLVSVQNEFSAAVRTSEAELERCDRMGIAFLPWSPLGGIDNRLGTSFPVFAEVAAAHGVSPQQVCLAWMLNKSPVVIPIPGARRPESIRDSALASDLAGDLTRQELSRLDAARRA